MEIKIWKCLNYLPCRSLKSMSPLPDINFWKMIIDLGYGHVCSTQIFFFKEQISKNLIKIWIRILHIHLYLHAFTFMLCVLYTNYLICRTSDIATIEAEGTKSSFFVKNFSGDKIWQFSHIATLYVNV